MNSNAIIVASFGTTYDETREKTIGALERLVAEKNPDCKIYRAFTSGKVISALAKRDIKVQNVSEMLLSLHSQGVKNIRILPTHLIPGVEYEKLCAMVALLEDKFQSIKIARPLLYSYEDMTVVCRAVAEHYNVARDTALLLMGHGTHHHSNSVYPALNYVFNDLGYQNIFVATVEGHPEIDSAISMMEQRGYNKVHLAPLMLVAGDHAQNDMAGEDEDSWKSILCEDGFEVTVSLVGLGEIKAIQDLYLSHI